MNGSDKIFDRYDRKGGSAPAAAYLEALELLLLAGVHGGQVAKEKGARAPPTRVRRSIRGCHKLCNRWGLRGRVCYDAELGAGPRQLLCPPLLVSWYSLLYGQC